MKIPKVVFVLNLEKPILKYIWKKIWLRFTKTVLKKNKTGGGRSGRLREGVIFFNKDSNSGLRKGLRSCISNKIPNDANSSLLGKTPGKANSTVRRKASLMCVQTGSKQD